MLEKLDDLDDKRQVIKLLNRLHQQMLDALNKVEAPNFSTTEDDIVDMDDRLWVSQGQYNERPILACRHGLTVMFTLNTDGTVAMMTRYHALTREDLFEVNAYMRACEEAIAGLNNGEVMAQRRDIDEALGAVKPEFLKTDWFRRLDDAMGT